MNFTNLTYDQLVEKQEELEKLLKKALPQKVKEIHELLEKEKRTKFTDKEFQIVVQIETWRRRSSESPRGSSGSGDHC